MHQDRFASLVNDTLKECHELLVVKGGEYAGTEDRLSNFKRGADLSGVTSLQVALIYMSKHYDAISTFIRDDAEGKTRPRSESIRGRIHDLINYCLLIDALIVENEMLDAKTTQETFNAAA